MPPTSWNNLPPELVARILEVRRETMYAEAHDRKMQAVLAELWKAKPRVFKRRLPACSPSS